MILLVGFHTYLRPCDLCRALVSDLVHPTLTSPHFARQVRTEELGRPAKTGQFHYKVLLDCEMGIKLGTILAVWCKGYDPSATLFNLSYVAVRPEFVEAMATSHLKDPSLYRLRHGGASHDRGSMTRTLDEVKKGTGVLTSRSLGIKRLSDCRRLNLNPPVCSCSLHIHTV